MRNWSRLVLWAMFMVGLALVALGNDHPFARSVVCDGLGVCLGEDAGPLGKLLYDVGIGIVLSLIFYWLLVSLPDRMKRRRLRNSLASHYDMFRENCISVILGVADGSYKLEHVSELKDYAAFRDYFKQKVSESEDRWHRFQNNLNEHSISELRVAMQVFRDEILFVLNNTDLSEPAFFSKRSGPEPFEFFKRLSAAIYSVRGTSPDYDAVARMAGFLWSILSGWSIVDGYRKEDIVERMIRSI